MSEISELRNKILFSASLVENNIKTRPDIYDILSGDVEASDGPNEDEDKYKAKRRGQAEEIASRIIVEKGDNTEQVAKWREERQPIFEYIVDFLHNSTFQVGSTEGPDSHFETVGKGKNLAIYPYLAPTGYIRESKLADGRWASAVNLQDENLVGAFHFQEQYRWDTYFQNRLIKAINHPALNEFAIGQLMNLVEVFKKYGRIPNALTTEFLSHPQPPFEALAAADFREGEGGVHVGDQGKWGEWYDEVMKTVEEELFTEWWDHGSGRIHPRQDTEFYKMYKPYMTRYVSVHFHPLLVGC